MSLQRRLTLFFVAIVIVPLTLAAFLIQQMATDEITRRAEMELEPALDSVTLAFNERAGALDERLRAALAGPRAAGLLQEERARALRVFLDDIVETSAGVDFALLVDSEGEVVASGLRPPRFVPGFDPPDEAELATGPQLGRGYLRSEVPVRLLGAGRWTLVGGNWLDELFLPVPGGDVDVSILYENVVVASTLSLREPERVQPTADVFTADLADSETRARVRPLTGGLAIMASSVAEPTGALAQRVLTSILGVLLVALIGTTILAYILARMVTRPVQELAEGARAVSEGIFAHRIPVRSSDEVGQLAAAFNDMTGRLNETITELQSSRDLLQRSVRRVGEMLRSTHDMKQMLETILDAVADAVDGDKAILWRFTPTRDELYPAVGRNLDVEALGRASVGEGLVGFVAERATSIALPTRTGGPHPSPKEPDLPAAIATCFYSQDRVAGVIVVYRDDPQRPFGDDDLDTLIFLAEQGGVAIENVLLHEEAQRLSLTDGLTGVFNRRYFQMQFRQVLATATRFERPFSVLMLDLDRFKAVNDTYGHQRGDAILIEFSQRLDSALREVDTVARYGGEEFICLLPETGLAGGMATAEKVLDAMRSEPFGGPGEVPINLTVSIGVACYPEHGRSFRSLVEAADRALYQAKEDGRDRVRAAGGPAGLTVAK